MALTNYKAPLKEMLKDYVVIGLAMLLYAVGYEWFVLPYKIVSGGMAGAAAIVYYVTHCPAQYIYFAINASLLVWAIIELGWQFCARTFFAVVSLTFSMQFVQWLTPICFDATVDTLRLVGEDRFMAVVIGSMMEGAGIGFCFLANGSSGGTDIIAAVLNKHRTVSLGRIIMAIDFMIVGGSYIFLRDWQTVVVGFVTLILSSLVLDYVVASTRRSMQTLIITSKEEEMARAINNEIGRGVTFLHGEGFYTKSERNVLLVLCKRRESQSLFRLIHRIDPNAFVSQSSCSGVYGLGFDRMKLK